EPALALELLRVAPQLLTELQRGVTRPLRVVLVRDGRPEERHDAITSVLVDCPLEAMDAVGEDREKPIHDLVPFLWIQLLCEIHRTLHVGKEHGYLLALALQSAPRGEDLFGEALRGIGARLKLRSRFGWRDGLSAAEAKAHRSRVRSATACACARDLE